MNSKTNSNKTAIIIGAGPAGLTAAYELLTKSNIKPIILEKSGDIGGISKTVNYKGNRIDIGGHRFFSKSKRVMDWWQNIMPVATDEDNITLTYQNKSTELQQPVKSLKNDLEVMLVRNRLSRIYFNKKFFAYPVQLTMDTLKKFGLKKLLFVGVSYINARINPRKEERTLEDFMINRFGKNLYNTFFKDYTEKVWGVPCNKIPAEWGAQRIKKLSLTEAVKHFLRKKKSGDTDIAQKNTHTTLIERFLYPAHGPGQLWEKVADEIKQLGGEIIHHANVTGFEFDNDEILAVHSNGERYEGDYFISTMPIKELVASFPTKKVPQQVQEIASGLMYRDFITVGVLVKHLQQPEGLKIEDNWIYIQDKGVKLGRLQVFNNWSPYMVANANTTWLGLEYFCNEGDDFWQMNDDEIAALGVRELEKIGLIRIEDVIDKTVIRVEKTYPAYFGTYDRIQELRNFTDAIPNLFLVGRNGMHRYNNADHSMLTAMQAVENILTKNLDKQNIWTINTDDEYNG